ncbi:hypothetical protein GSI_10766 [Ganoderma sinense ZZ0214-1]|uniref:Uncharacterized protein n=1 Tax=Ganoderma sinense ZZ0214-1 TaxID=1077348 RepID=A0A2G8S1J2_9APHY|nr:hypothetical protein GSI_10766 [Ganoderma sinense ZZ0214-1]
MVWKGKVTGAAVIFVLNRYIGLLNTAFDAVSAIANLSDEVRRDLCNALKVCNIRSNGQCLDRNLVYDLGRFKTAPLGGATSVNFGKKSLLHVFLRNETLYFIIIIALGLVTFGIYVLQIADIEKNYTYLSIFTTAISNILISQFLLELQTADKRTRAGGSLLSSTNSGISTVVFDRLIGPIGLASVTPEDEDEGP